MPATPVQPEGPQKSLFDIAKEVIEEKAAQVGQPQEPVLPLPQTEARPLAEVLAEEMVRPAFSFVEEYSEEAIENEKGFKKFLNRVVERWEQGKEKRDRLINTAIKGARKFIKENRHEMNKILGKTPEERRRKVIILLLIGVAVAGGIYNWKDLFKKGDGDGDGDGGAPTPEGQGEPNYELYYASALRSWQRFREIGYMPGAMLDPTAIDNRETIAVTGYFPGWPCVPERIAVCEQMVGEFDYPGKNAQLPENPVLRGVEIKKLQAEQEVFFIQMREEWDEVWWPKIKANPNLSQEVKDFHDPANRDNLRQWFRDHYPIPTPTKEGFNMMRQTVADKMFLDFLETGKLVPVRPNILTYSHLLGSFVAMVLTAGQPIQLPMTEAGFIPETGGKNMQSGLLPADAREAYRQIEIISRRPDSNLLDIAPHAKIVNDYNAQIEISRQLKAGSLGRL